MKTSILASVLAGAMLVSAAVGQTSRNVNPTQRFNLNGLWQRADNPKTSKLRFEQTGDTLKVFLNLGDSDALLFHGRYSGGVIVGQRLTSVPTITPEEWADETIYVESPDRVHYHNRSALVRVSAALPSDAVCDLQNSSHTEADKAYARAWYAINHDAAPVVDECWMEVSAQQGNARAQANTSMFYSSGDGVPKNLNIAFAWAKKSAEQQDPMGEELLADMYRKGIGTAPNPTLAQYWQDKFKQLQTADWDAKINETVQQGVDMALREEMGKEASQQAQGSEANCHSAGGDWVYEVDGMAPIINGAQRYTYHCVPK